MHLGCPYEQIGILEKLSSGGCKVPGYYGLKSLLIQEKMVTSAELKDSVSGPVGHISPICSNCIETCYTKAARCVSAMNVIWHFVEHVQLCTENLQLHMKFSIIP